MKMRIFCFLFFLIQIDLVLVSDAQAQIKTASNRYLYVATPGVRDYLGYGGHGILVFDINDHHRFVKRIPAKGLHPNGKPSNVKGIAVSIQLNSLYVSTLESLQRIDLTSEKVIWEKQFEGGCDRMSISPDGQTIYLPSLEKGFWNVVDCKTGDIIKKIDVHKRAHNTIYGPSGKLVYMGDIGSHWLHIADAKTHELVAKVGEFESNVRPFTINAAETMVYVTVDSLLGFEVGDLKRGNKIAHIVVEGWEKGPVRRHGNPSHGIGLTPDEKELWLCDGHNMRLHLFSATPPYQQLTTIPVRDMPGWVTFTIDGKYAYPSSGEVIEVKTRKVVSILQDEFNNNVGSEKMLEIQFEGKKAVRAGDQFGIGRAGNR
jgi:DNA-binding beta-propeller fold protein YncE